ncbi:hypothetical protein [Mesorhizobium sp.]|uniref:hypothetical protein n=1 Tax=Mesorhizobium sp. TaxID=1871066 RepID=UPI00257EFCE9|nr:hypothetical protein [Mesorhizobium sp.]
MVEHIAWRLGEEALDLGVQEKPVGLEREQIVTAPPTILFAAMSCRRPAMTSGSPSRKASTQFTKQGLEQLAIECIDHRR